MDWISVTIKVTLTLIALIGLFLLNKQKTSDPDFYQACIVRLSNILRLLLLTYKQTLHRMFLRSYFLFTLNFTALSNTLLTFIYFWISKWNIISCFHILFLSLPSNTNEILFISTKYVVSKVPKLWSLRWLCREISPHFILWTIFDLYIFLFNFICHLKKVMNIWRPSWEYTSQRKVYSKL